MNKSLRLDSKEELDAAVRRWELTHRNAQRLGQFLINNHYRGEWAELFYEDDRHKAYAIALSSLAQQ